MNDVSAGETSRTPRLFATALSLYALLGLSVVAWRLDLGLISTALSLLIAAAKALIVALFFMDLRRSAVSVRLAAAAGLLWVAIMLMLTAADYETRPPGTRLGSPTPSEGESSQPPWLYLPPADRPAISSGSTRTN